MEHQVKIVLKSIGFLNFVFFFAIFGDVGSIWGGPGPSKNLQKLTTSRKNRVWDALGTRLGFLIDFGSDLGAIWKDFEWILNDFGRI